MGAGPPASVNTLLATPVAPSCHATNHTLLDMLNGVFDWDELGNTMIMEEGKEEAKSSVVTTTSPAPPPILQQPLVLRTTMRYRRKYVTVELVSAPRCSRGASGPEA